MNKYFCEINNLLTIFLNNCKFKFSPINYIFQLHNFLFIVRDSSWMRSHHVILRKTFFWVWRKCILNLEALHQTVWSSIKDKTFLFIKIDILLHVLIYTLIYSCIYIYIYIYIYTEWPTHWYIKYQSLEKDYRPTKF